MGRGTHPEVRDGSGNPPGGLRWVGGPSGWSRMGWWTLREVRDGSGDARGGPGQVGGPSRRFRMVGGPSGWSGTGLGRSGTGRGTLM